MSATEPIIQTYNVTIDSRYRDTIKYPDVNDYEIVFPNSLFGIQSIELIQAEIPNTEYMVNNDNKYIDFLFNGTQYTAILCIGDYCGITGFTNMVTNIMNTTVGPLPPPPPLGLNYKMYKYIECKGGGDTSKFLITIGGPPFPPGPPPAGNNFVFLFGSGPNKNRSARFLLGFPEEKDYEFTVPPPPPPSIPNWSTNILGIISPGRYNLSGPPHALLRLGDGIDNFSMISQEGNIANMFAVLSLNECLGDFVYYFSMQYKNIYYFYQGAKPVLSRLRIQFFKQYGKNIFPFNFNGIDHTLTFRITARIDKMGSKRLKEITPTITLTELKDEVVTPPIPYEVGNHVPMDDFMNSPSLHTENKSGIEHFTDNSSNKFSFEKHKKTIYTVGGVAAAAGGLYLLNKKLRK